MVVTKCLSITKYWREQQINLHKNNKFQIAMRSKIIYHNTAYNLNTVLNFKI